MGTTNAMKELLQAGANPNHRHHNGETPLFYATDDEEVAVLVNAGADLEAVDNDGNTALGRAIYISVRGVNNVESLTYLINYVTALINHGANPCVTIHNRREPQRGLLEDWLYTISGQDLNRIFKDRHEVNDLRAQLTRILVRAQDAWRAAHPE